jgi:hypothetical protein
MAKGKKTGGRVKGSKNKLQRDSREHVLETAARLERDGLGLYEWAKNSPDEFWKLYGKTLPRPVEVSGPDGGPLTVEVLSYATGKIASQFCPEAIPGESA